MSHRWNMEVFDAMAQLVCSSPAFAWPHELPLSERRAEMERRLALRQHIIDFAHGCKTVAEFQAALQADGTLDKLG